MAAKGKAPHQVKSARTTAWLEAELKKRTAERDDALAREATVAAERDEALAQQTATAEVLGVINASPGDLAPVFEAMLERAMRLCEATHGHLSIYDGEHFRHAVIHGASDTTTRQVGPIDASPVTPFGRLVRGESIVHLTDAMADEAYEADPSFRGMVDKRGLRSSLSVALRRENSLHGAIVIYRQQVRPFTDKQIALLQAFAAQAVIAMENARLITETREALEQQTASAEVLQVINSSPGDLTPVFDAMLERALKLCDVSYGVLQTYDGECFHVVAERDNTQFRERMMGPLHPEPGTTMERIVHGETLIHIADMKEDAAYRHGSRVRRAMVDVGGFRSMVSIALRTDEILLGALHVYRQDVRPFTNKQIELLRNFAAQAVVAMENARLITETHEALKQQTATAEVLGVINASPGDLAPVFDAMLEKATRLCEAAFGVLWTHEGESFRAAALLGVPAAYAEFVTRTPRGSRPGGALGRLARGEEVVHVPETGAGGDAPNDPIVRTMVELGGIRTLLAVPLRKDNVLLGAFTIYRQEVRPFTDKQIALLKSFAAQAVIAMDNARLLSELRQRTEEVAELNRGLEARVAEQVEELGRVGRLKRFLAPQLAELIVSQGDEKILESHRREIVVVFCDLRGYTAFTETAEPEEVLDFLREYHGALGPLISQFEGTLDQFSGDGIMVFFNDPVPIPDPAERAVKMAMAMREAAGKLIAAWRRHGSELGFGIGIAQGYATLGQIGFSERSGYTAIGTVCNLAARLCAEARDGQILVSSRIAEAVETVARLEDLGNLELRGLRRPIAAFNILQSASSDSRPNLTVVAREPGA